MPGKRDRLIAQFAARNRKPPKRITEDDPRWVQQLAHGPGQERKVGANVTRPYGYVGRRAKQRAKRDLPTRFS